MKHNDWQGSKVCSQCYTNKPLLEYQRRGARRAAHCKECQKKYDRARNLRNREGRRLSAKQYYQKNKKKWRAKQEKQKKDDPLKYKARVALRNAVYTGKVKKLPCIKCGEPKTHGHHTDYSKPLKVQWLCVKHHYELHTRFKSLKEIEATYVRAK